MISDISYALRLPLGVEQGRMQAVLNHGNNSTNTLRPEFSYYTKDENGKLLKEPCGFPGQWTVEVKILIKEDTNAGVQRLVKSFSLSMQSSRREDVQKAKFTVVEALAEDHEGVLAGENDFYIKSSDKFGIEIVIEASFLKKGISSQRAIFTKIAEKIPKQTDLIIHEDAKTQKPKRNKIKKAVVINTPPIELVARDFTELSSTAFTLASLLKQSGYDVSITNVGMLDSKLKLEKEFEGIDIVCISAYDEQLSYIRELTDYLKERNPNIIIAVGGPSVTIAPEHVFSYLPSADIFYRGEAEAGFIEALSGLENLNFASTRGAAVHSGDTYYFNDFISLVSKL